MLNSAHHLLLTLEESKIVTSDPFTDLHYLNFHFAKLLIFLFNLAVYFSALRLYFTNHLCVFGQRNTTKCNFTVLWQLDVYYFLF